MATLTGAQGIATGAYHAAILTNNEDCETSCSKAGRISGDLVVCLAFFFLYIFSLFFVRCLKKLRNSCLLSILELHEFDRKFWPLFYGTSQKCDVLMKKIDWSYFIIEAFLQEYVTLRTAITFFIFHCVLSNSFTSLLNWEMFWKMFIILQDESWT